MRSYDATRPCPVLPRLLVPALLALAAGGCQEPPQGADDPDDPDATDSGTDEETESPVLADYLAELPSWTEFSPPRMDRDSTPVDGADVEHSEETVEDVQRVGEDGTLEPLGDVTYECTETPYSMTDNPGQLVVADPNRDVLYPGAFLQGRTHRDAISIGDVLPLTIEKRTPVRVSVPDVSTPDGENFRQVQPNQAEVAQAIGAIVGNATQDDLQTPSSISFEMQTYHSEQQFALEAGVSGRYLGFSASASGSVESNASETTVAVQFTQRMFTAVVEPPGAGPETFFSDEFTAADLQALVDSGRLGPDNLPVYVSSVVYGRMMTFAMTSTASESEIKAALRASYNSVAGGGSASLSAKDRSVLEQSTVVLTTLGGNAADALRVIRSGDWAEYFSNEAALSTAVPLSYTFKNLGDNSIASVSEASEFTVKTCAAKQASPGLFEVAEVQAFDLGIGDVSDVVVGDENGDGLDDIIFNSRGDHNTVAVVRAHEDGVFEHVLTREHALAPSVGSWAGFVLQPGDVDGDGDTDLVWNRNGPCSGTACIGNEFYVSLARGGPFTPGVDYRDLPQQATAHPQWSGGAYNFSLADVNGDGLADPILTSVGVRPREDPNWTHLGLATGSGGFRLDDLWQRHSVSAGWHPYDTVVDDFSGDGLADIAWNRRESMQDTSPVHSFFARAELRELPASAVALDDAFVEQALLAQSAVDEGWDSYAILSGDILGGPGAELVWVRTADNQVQTRWATSDGVGFTAGEPTPAQDLGFDTGAGAFAVRLGNVAGSDRDDLVVNYVDGPTNWVAVGLSAGDGSFDSSPAPQRIEGDETWSQFDLYVGNFGGSAKRDLAWVLPTDRTRIYVAIAD